MSQSVAGFERTANERGYTLPCGLLPEKRRSGVVTAYLKSFEVRCHGLIFSLQPAEISPRARKDPAALGSCRYSVQKTREMRELKTEWTARTIIFVTSAFGRAVLYVLYWNRVLMRSYSNTRTSRARVGEGGELEPRADPISCTI